MKVYRWSSHLTAFTPRDKKKELMKRVTSEVNQKYGMGSVEKKVGRKKPVTLPKLKFMEDYDDREK